MKDIMCNLDGEDVSIEYELESPSSILDDLKDLQSVSMTFASPIFEDDRKDDDEPESIYVETSYKPPSKKKDNDETPMIMLNERKPKEKKKKEKKKKSTSLESFSDDIDLLMDDNDEADEEDRLDILDIDKLFAEREKRERNDDEIIIDKGRKGYKKLKKNENKYKNEFAEELTLLYTLLDETTKYANELEKDFKATKSSKVRGVSKYTNDLAELILNAKQTKLNILKEMTSVKKTIADLVLKSEKDKTKDDEKSNNLEALASRYYKNIISSGRSYFVGPDEDGPVESDNSYIPSYDDEEAYEKLIEERLTNTGNPMRSADADAYIKYEGMNIQIKIKRCIDTGEWEFVALDKTNQIIDDYPVPTKKSAGRMKFSPDGNMATDQYGRIYNVIEYYLPDEDDSDDEDDEY